MENPTDGPSKLAIQVYDEILERFGEPDLTLQSDLSDGHESRLDIFAWYPSTTVPLTTFATVGMCDRPMVDCLHRAELHFARQGDLSDAEIEAVAGFLARLAGWPSRRSVSIDWWHLLSDLEEVPTYPGCSAALMHPAFTHGGWDRIQTDEYEVRMFNVVPLTIHEVKAIKTEGLRPTMERLTTLESGMFAPR